MFDDVNNIIDVVHEEKCGPNTKSCGINYTLWLCLIIFLRLQNVGFCLRMLGSIQNVGIHCSNFSKTLVMDNILKQVLMIHPAKRPSETKIDDLTIRVLTQSFQKDIKMMQ